MNKVLAIFCLAVGVAHAAPHPETLRTWDEFTKLIESNSVLSIDDLLHVLPKDFLQGHALIYQTRALNRQLVSEARPRVLVYGTDGKFMMTYNSHVSGEVAKPGDVESIEAIEFRDDGARLREVVFDGVSSPLSRKIEVNPPKCTQCHGQDPRGLWDPYNHWAGVYGSLSRGFVDFIRLPTPDHPIHEYDAFLEFLKERQKNPRYSLLDLSVTTLSRLSQQMDAAGTPLDRPFVADKMNDALVFKDGHGYFTNQLVGIFIGEENFKRMGRMLSRLPRSQRSAYQYLLRGISLDEHYQHILKDKKFTCMKKIEQFLPDTLSVRGVLDFPTFHDQLNISQEQEYNPAKAAVEKNNLGLSKISPGFSNADPFDLDMKGRDLVYDMILPPLVLEKLYGMSGTDFVLYAFYLMNLPYENQSPAADGTRFNFIYGQSGDCLNEYGQIPDKSCQRSGLDSFVTRFVPDSFFTDPDIDKMTCDQLAAKSKQAIQTYLAGSASSK